MQLLYILWKLFWYFLYIHVVLGYEENMTDAICFPSLDFLSASLCSSTVWAKLSSCVLFFKQSSSKREKQPEQDSSSVSTQLLSLINYILPVRFVLENENLIVNTPEKKWI